MVYTTLNSTIATRERIISAMALNYNWYRYWYWYWYSYSYFYCYHPCPCLCPCPCPCPWYSIVGSVHPIRPRMMHPLRIVSIRPLMATMPRDQGFQIQTIVVDDVDEDFIDDCIDMLLLLLLLLLLLPLLLLLLLTCFVFEGNNSCHLDHNIVVSPFVLSVVVYRRLSIKMGSQEAVRYFLPSNNFCTIEIGSECH